MTSTGQYEDFEAHAKRREKEHLLSDLDTTARANVVSKDKKSKVYVLIGVIALVALALAGCSTRTAVAQWNMTVQQDDFACPGSPSSVHASCVLEAKMDGPCEDVIVEAYARVAAQNKGWVDPHNNGTYSKITMIGDGRYELSRLTGDKKYTDKIGFQLTATPEGKCIVRGCSESQVTSLKDFSTNYCNIRNLFCSATSSPVCKTVKHDIGYSESKVSPSFAASANAKDCVVPPKI